MAVRMVQQPAWQIVLTALSVLSAVVSMLVSGSLGQKHKRADLQSIPSTKLPSFSADGY